MPYTIEDFRRDAQKEVLSRLTLEQRLAGLTPEQQVTGLTPAQLASTLSPEVFRQLAKEMKKKSRKP